jgi:hypothetical protein
MGLYIIQTVFVIQILYFQHLLNHINHLSSRDNLSFSEVLLKQYALQYSKYYHRKFMTITTIFTIINGVIIHSYESLTYKWVIGLEISQLFQKSPQFILYLSNRMGCVVDDVYAATVFSVAVPGN